jgi:hypothetical protein
MTDRITSPDENISDEEVVKETPKKVLSPLYPKDYTNPFEDPDQYPNHEADDTYPYIFSDVDFELKQRPRLFNGFEDPKIQEQIEAIISDPTNTSKSGIERIWQYGRWKTWKYLYELSTREVVINLEENEQPGKARGTVSINGVTFYILKGVYISAPVDVAEMIKVSQKQTNAAGQQSLLASLSLKLDPVTGLPKDLTRLER